MNTVPEIKVGVLHSLTGTMAISEQHLADVALMAVEEINQGGGVLGRRVRAIVQDGASDPGTFAAKAEELLAEEQVATIFGCWTSSSRKAVKPVVERHLSLLWYPVQYEGLEESPNIIYTGSCLNQQITPAVHWALAGGKRRCFLLGSDYVFPRIANGLIYALVAHGNGHVLDEQYVPLGSSDFAEAVAAIERLQPDIVFSTINGEDNLAFFREYNRRGLDPDACSVMSFSLSETELRNDPEIAAGHYACWSYFQGLQTREALQFLRNLRKRFGENWVASDPLVTAYTQVHLWKQVVEAAGALETEAVLSHATGQSVLGPGGLIEIQPNHHVKKPALIGRATADGQFDVVWRSDRLLDPKPWLGAEDTESPSDSLILKALSAYPESVHLNWEFEQEIARRKRVEASLQQKTADLVRANALIAALGQVTTRAQATLDIEKVMETLSAELDKLGFGSFVALLDRDDGALVIPHVSVKSKLLTLVEKLTGIKIGGFRIQPERLSSYDQLIKQRLAVFVPDATADVVSQFPGLPWPVMERVLRAIGVGSDVHSIQLPLAVEERLLGVLVVWGADLREEDVSALSAFSAQMAATLEMARLYQEAQKEISERKRAEEMLYEKEETQRVLLNATTEAAFLGNLEGRILAANQVAAQRFGRTVEELIGLSLDEYLPPELAESRKTRADQVVRTRKPVRFQDDRAGRVFDTNIAPILDAAGEVAAFAVYSRDITEAKQAEKEIRKHRDHLEELVAERTTELREVNEQLRQEIAERKLAEIALAESNEKFRTIFDKSPNPMMLVDADSRTILEVNQAYIDSRGVIADEIVNTPDRLGWSAADADILSEMLEIYHDTGCLSGYEHSAIGKGGKELRELVFAEPIDIQGHRYTIVTIVDITERKRAEEALQESETRFRAVAEANPAAIFVVQDERFVFVNPSALSLTGYSSEEIMGMHYLDPVHPDYREMVRKNARGRLAGSPVPERYELRFITKSGEARWLVFAPRLISYGGKPSIMVAGIDITEKKKAELELQAHRDHLAELVDERTAELRESESKFRVIVQDQTEFISRWDPDGTLIFVNDRYCDLYNTSQEELVGNNVFDIISPKAGEKLKQVISKITPEQPTYTDEYLSVSEEGKGRWFQWTERGIFDQDERLIAIQSVGREITEQKRAEEALRQSEEKFRAIVQDQTDFIMRYLPDTTLTFVNESYCRHMEKSPDDLIGTRFLDELPDEHRQRVQEKLASLTPDEPVATDEYSYITPDGEELWESWTDRGIFDENGQLVEVQAVGQDITPRKQAEEELRRRTEELEMFNKVMVDREMRIIEMKEEVNKLCEELSREPAYPPVWRDSAEEK